MDLHERIGQRPIQTLEKPNFFTPEVKKPRTRYHVYIVRHGQATEYGKDTAPLEASGEEDVHNFVRDLTTDISLNHKRAALRVLFSPLTRTRQCANISDLAIKELQNEGEINNIIYGGIWYMPDLRTTKEVVPMIQKGIVTPQEAVGYWATHTDLVKKTMSGVFRMIGDLDTLSMQLGEQFGEMDRYQIWWTHETTHLGFLLAMNGAHQGNLPTIKHTEALRLDIGLEDGQMQYNWRGQTKPFTLKMP